MGMCAGRDSPMCVLDNEILRMVVEMARERTGAQRWKFVEVYIAL